MEDKKGTKNISAKREAVTNASETKTKKLKGKGGANVDKPGVEWKYDNYYKFREPGLLNNDNPVEFIPVYFLRTHSKNNDPADVQTQLWQCQFEPDLEVAGQYTNIVATCGGTSVCFIDSLSGEVVLKYNKGGKGSGGPENLYAQAWSSVALDDMGLTRINIVAVGGVKSNVKLMHPEQGVCYSIFRTTQNKAGTVCSLLFHPKKSTWLFCGHEDGRIQLWDVGVPRLPNYEVTPVHLLTIEEPTSDIYNMVYSKTHDLLIAGCDAGLFAWRFDMEKIQNNERLDFMQFQLPKASQPTTVVDSIILVRDDILAVKCPLHGLIYVFRISDALKHEEAQGPCMSSINPPDELVVRLRWSDTDNYYMNMGCDAQSGLLVCGDDKGALWVYELFSYLNGDISSPLTGGTQLPFPVEPKDILEWPEVEDTEVEKARKLRLDTYDIVVDNCTVSRGGKTIVAVTSNNMVCIWRRGGEDHPDEAVDKRSKDSVQDQEEK
ncbi:leucine-rich repeat and WD repeat-containing protein 1-like isoform X2 [Oratosquilla oratoria]